MILRRLSRHVGEQNWFAVLLDFIIVVLGVYMGVLLGNWNSQSLASRSERAVLMQLHEEVVAAQAQLAEPRIAMPGIDEALRVFVDSYFSDKDTIDAETICNFASMTSLMPNILGRLSAIEELISTGRLSQLSSEELRLAITDFHEMTALNELRFAELRESSTPLEREFSDYYLRTAFVGDDGEIRLTGECDTDAMQNDTRFRNAFARNLDVFDLWRNRFVRIPTDMLRELHELVDLELGIVHEEDAPPGEDA
ncbi:hypothetical protein [Ponticaulis sp.]|uniref:hypothetical protein n=1 Tax=Ponticaulis sp. TaxID=2020902 RepID=UPI000B764245|nr:hypothetical protein [Ponticaulis sp.]MAI90362.1 hypothetical protein [Ponticaulis sp.]OUX99998.1 MAG: hypothetical protein CBB65_07975 [Hyphomonadaceae bacterium TMED5]|tara:strand:+ start:334268 stop:335026 length:759 start_codon:yes stop_codon:yes gene_type:complete